jgi:hypothetical protein
MNQRGKPPEASARHESRDLARATRASARRKAPGTPLTRERIVGAALGIVDRDGLAALSMRRLGA